ncbi:MAG: hypothetical protein Pars92KO_23720 [Parasphingorhabdus sp.]
MERTIEAQQQIADRQSLTKPQTKGERTRARLLEAAKVLLERYGYHDLKVTDVPKEAGVAAGVFYTYFKNKEELVLQLFDDVLARNIELIFTDERASNPFEAVLSANRRYVELFATGKGLNRAVGQIVDSLPEARTSWQRANWRVAEWIAKGIARHSGKGVPDETDEFAALALQAMLDSILMQTYAYRDPALAKMAKEPERLAYELSVLWYRAAYGREPSNTEKENVN